MDRQQPETERSVSKKIHENTNCDQSRQAKRQPKIDDKSDPIRPKRKSSATVNDIEDDLFQTLEAHAKGANNTTGKEKSTTHGSNDYINTKIEHNKKEKIVWDATERIKTQEDTRDNISAKNIQLEEPPKSKFITGVLSIFLGPLGAHWFYQRKKLRGTVYLAIACLLTYYFESLMPAFSIFCLTEGVFIIASAPESFRWYYHKHLKTFAFWCCLVISAAVYLWVNPANTAANHKENVAHLAATEIESKTESLPIQTTAATEPAHAETEESVAETAVPLVMILPFDSVAGNALASVMMGKNNFTMAETGAHQTLFNMTEFMQFTFENYLMPTSFCVVDMDQDGTNEIIVGIDTDINGFRLVLRYEYGTVYGYPFNFRGLKSVSTDGLITASSSAFESPTIRLSFNGLSIEQYNLSYAEEQAALASWQDATWYDFTEDNVGKFFPDMNISFTFPSAPPPSSAGQQNDTTETYINGYVKYGTVELRVRSGPGTEYEDIGRLREGTQVVILETTHSGGREWGRTEHGWVCMDYIQEGEPEESYINASSMYALDYINGTTGDVLNRVGRNYITGGGFSGSSLFYYGSNPDMQFGFVPYDWTNPKINGSEPISVILLDGNAKISANLSADMNKSQLDAAAWGTPNVINVSGQYTYGDMWGSVYMYEIETTYARILYMWYLDSGDNVDYPAGEVTVSPK